ncbi:flagellar motor switch protein FliG [Desulfomicrobium apsheronum]|uniref:Flagellar motor switch protein FliG n=3 Tax=Desulfomicrobium TaxID=898 RepID=A0A1I3RQE5_9BACT|nr:MULTISPECIES: flagellar motor switch protein FliG [Desulfomicrobium]MBE1424007.1 flagellar motor switch protein FliG [Desulfomicrobium macestii]MDY0225765.1 flagellar motor switch protein FliG [Desulfomicrobium apsheronum]SFJ48545.1 flagellar motor switch protein FliG [Desulfomicrobium apsheronum]SFL42144.1 flagellar motor switch protein FliG [Desulfomicrobium norvegicum]
MAAPTGKLTGPQKTAILILALGDAFASEVFKKFERAEITAVSRAMAKLDTVNKEQAEEVLKEFNQAMTIGKEMLYGGPEQVRKMISSNLDSDTARYILDELDFDSGPVPFKELGNVSPKILAQILRNEHPQTLALILGHLPSDSAGNLLQNMAPGVRAEVLIRLAKLEAVAEEMLVEVDRVLQSQLIAIGGKEGRKVGGVNSVAEILNAIDRATEEEIMADIEEESAQLAEEIKQLMFVFEDITKIDDRGIREVLKEISNEDLTMSLKTAPEELREKFFKNLSERAGNMIREDLEIMGPVKLSEVEAAQQNIVKQVRRLEAEGRIVIAGSGGEVLV